MTTIEQELLKATGEKPRGKKEEVVDYLQRVAEAVDSDKVSEKAWDALSDEAQEWFEKASAALSNGNAEDIPRFDNAVKEEQQTETKPSSGKEETKVATAKGRKEEKKAVAPTAKGKAEKAPKAKKEPRKTSEEVREGSAADVVKLIVCEHPSWSEDQVKAELKNRKVRCRDGRLHSQYRQTHRVIQFLEKFGKLK